MASARQLLYHAHEGKSLPWTTELVRGMRQLREDGRYWRVDDAVGFCTGPNSIGGIYPLTPQVWRSWHEGDTLFLAREILGTLGEVEYQYQHTAPILTTSPDFDQLGRPILLWEDTDGAVWLHWFDPVVGDMTTQSIGPGRTPRMATTRAYKRAGSTTDSERLVFYCDDTGILKMLRQAERFQNAYAVGTQPAPMLELLQATKSLFGGLIVVGAYRDGLEVKAHVQHYRDDSADLVIGDDRFGIEQAGMGRDTNLFAMNSTYGLIEVSAVDATAMSRDNDTFVMDLGESTVEIGTFMDTPGSMRRDSNLYNMVAESAEVDLGDPALFTQPSDSPGSIIRDSNLYSMAAALAVVSVPEPDVVGAVGSRDNNTFIMEAHID